MKKRFISFAVAIAALAALISPSVYAADPFGGIGTAATQTSVSTCAYENLGWILCPVLNATATAGDFAFSFMAQTFTQLEIGLVDNDSGARQAGAVIRNFANILFVMAFLAIVYSLVTGQGIGNYNLKRLVPRFIVAVIFVQVSYFICQLMVDFSNILGFGVRDILVTRVADSIGPSAMPLASALGQDVTPLSSIASGVTSNGDIAWQLLAPLGAIVMSATVICSILIVVLIIRKVLVVALMMVAPLAFVAYLLPNTSDYFSKWLKIFTHTLLLFPVISLLLGAGQIVSASILKVGGSEYQIANDKITIDNKMEQSATLYLVAAGAAVLPLVGTWYAFKAITNSIDAAGARVSRDGFRRSSRERDEKAKQREQTTMDLNKKSMMLRGINRIQQLNTAQNGEGGTSIFGRTGAHRGRGKHAPKSPEQARFDTQVQQRLGEIREKAVVTGQSPQELYSHALQRYQEKMGDVAGAGDGGLNINSYEGIDLKASEAYLLESLGRGSTSAIGTTGVAGTPATTTGQDDQKEKKSAGISSLDRDNKSSNGTGNSDSDQPQVDGYRQPNMGDITGVMMANTASGAALTSAASPSTAGAKPTGVMSASAASTTPTTGAATQGGAVIVQQVQSTAGGATVQIDPMANGTGFAARRPVQDSNEQLAKARAAKYVADSQNPLQQLEELIPTPGPVPQNNNDEIPKE